jgi:hypothetical protein
LSVGVVTGSEHRDSNVVVRNQTEIGRIHPNVAGFAVRVHDPTGVDYGVGRDRDPVDLPWCLDRRVQPTEHTFVLQERTPTADSHCEVNEVGFIQRLVRTLDSKVLLNIARPQVARSLVEVYWPPALQRSLVNVP